LVGQPCGHHGQYTFYKALRLTGAKERIIAIGDFFFVRVWQDSELVSIACGQHGQHTIYKALRLTGAKERIIAIGDFFFVRVWQDSELVSIGK
ncbi:putative AT-rich interactive domain-containing protein 5B, partial [Operophtera brumata]